MHNIILIPFAVMVTAILKCKYSPKHIVCTCRGAELLGGQCGEKSLVDSGTD